MSTRVTVLPETRMLTRTVGTAKINLSKQEREMESKVGKTH